MRAAAISAEAIAALADLVTWHAFADVAPAVVVLALRYTALSSLAAFAVAALYLVKSAVGIDLFPGHSPLHDLLYPLLRRA